MQTYDFAGLLPAIQDKIAPLLDEILKAHGANIHSFHIVGSAVIPDYDEKLSDVNSVVVLHKMDLQFVEFLAPLGKKYGKKRIAAPLIMTPEYISGSLDAFPVEFLDFKLIHKTVYGTDILATLGIDRSHLRLQCEREVKTKLIGLRQGYISSLGKKDELRSVLIRSFTGSMAFFRAVTVLLGKEPPIERTDVISAFGSSLGIDAGVFESLLLLKTGRSNPSEEGLRSLFEHYYNALESTGTIVDELPS